MRGGAVEGARTEAAIAFMTDMLFLRALSLLSLALAFGVCCLLWWLYDALLLLPSKATLRIAFGNPFFVGDASTAPFVVAREQPFPWEAIY